MRLFIIYIAILLLCTCNGSVFASTNDSAFIRITMQGSTQEWCTFNKDSGINPLTIFQQYRSAFNLYI